MKCLALFNGMGRLGASTLTFNLAHMFARMGHPAAAVDLDPQCGLSELMLSDDSLCNLWEDDRPVTAAHCLEPVRLGRGAVLEPLLITVERDLALLPGDPALALFEQRSAEEWALARASGRTALPESMQALHRLCRSAGEKARAEIVLLDTGPGLGALNRAALLACDQVVVPIGPDLFSLRGLQIMGPALREWGQEWAAAQPQARPSRLPCEPIGYIVHRQFARLETPVIPPGTWWSRIPSAYRTSVLGLRAEEGVQVLDDPHCLASLEHMASLLPLAQVARRPLFDLRRADGVGGKQLRVVYEARDQFERLARSILERLG